MKCLPLGTRLIDFFGILTPVSNRSAEPIGHSPTSDYSWKILELSALTLAKQYAFPTPHSGNTARSLSNLYGRYGAALNDDVGNDSHLRFN